jgi:hypothetical protein
MPTKIGIRPITPVAAARGDCEHGDQSAGGPGVDPVGHAQKREQADGAGGKKQELTEIVYESC